MGPGWRSQVVNAIEDFLLIDERDECLLGSPLLGWLNSMRWMMLSCVATAALSAAQLAALAQPLEGNPLRGRQIATTLCSSCHRVLPMTLPDKGDPPSFQSIADLPSTTGLSLKVFLRSPHRNMPNLILSEAESDDVIAYILSLKKN